MQENDAKTILPHFIFVGWIHLTTVGARKRIYIQKPHSMVLKLVAPFFDHDDDSDIGKAIAIKIREYIGWLADHSKCGFDLSANLLSNQIVEFVRFDADVPRLILSEDE